MQLCNGMVKKLLIDMLINTYFVYLTLTLSLAEINYNKTHKLIALTVIIDNYTARNFEVDIFY
jgi:hypothetical protein